MRIGLVIYGDLETISGGYLYDRMLVNQLRATGHTVDVISLPWRDYAHHLRDNVSVGLYRQLRGLEVDLLLQDELNHPSLAWVNDRLSGDIGFPVVSIVHHLRSSEEHPPQCLSLYRHVEKRYLRSVDGFIFNSNTTRVAVEALASPGRPGIVAYPAADHTAPPDQDTILVQRQRACHNGGPLQVVFVGNVIPRKGLHQLLAALARLPHSSWRLDVIGSLSVDPGYVATVRRLIDKSDCQGSVRLWGYLPDRELRDRLQACHVLAVPSFEGFGIVYLEAMAFGLPVIASTAGAAHEVVDHGRTGFLVEPSDEQGMADYFANMHRDRDQLLRMSEAARRRYDHHPSWQQSAQTIIQWLQDRVADGRANAV